MLKINTAHFPPSRLAVSLIFFLVGFMYTNLFARLPRLQSQYQLDNGDLSLVLLTVSIGALVSMPITGKVIVDTGSRKLTIGIAIAFLILYPSLLIGGSLASLFFFAFLLGMANGSLDIAMNAQAVLVEKQIDKPVMSSFHAIFSAGMMIGAGTGALFTRLEIELLPHLALMTGIGLLGLFWASRQLIPDQPEKTSSGDKKSPKWKLRSDLVALGLISFCCMLGEGAMADWSTNFMLNDIGTSEYLAPIGLAAFSTAMMIGRFLGDYARIRFGDAKLMQIGSFFSLVGMVLVLGPMLSYIGILGFFLVGIGLATIVPIAYSRAGSAEGMPPGMGISIVSAVGYSGFLIGPPVIGFVGDAFGLRIGLAFVLLLFILMLILSVKYQRDEPKFKGKLSETI